MSDLSRFLAGGAAGRDDSLTGLSPAMQNALAAMMAEAPEGYFTINSAYRSSELQAQLYEDALRRYGSEAEARRWVAPPGRSQHNHGAAVDLGFSGDEARAWAHANAQRFGLAFPLDNEDWHLELAGARGGAQQGVPMAPPEEALGGQGNALAGYASDDQGQPRDNALRQFVLDPSAFMARGYAPAERMPAPQMQRYATRYLGNV